jgi:crotonobetainyl-CoA:carnitine CoA-transferase CaiB-like acyl-CoA transferase
MLAGPYCGMLLADLGAEVIKIETGDGDIARYTGRHHVGSQNVYFASLNRNKKSVLIDIKTSDGRRMFERLVQSADALITNLRPDAIRRLGLDYEALKSVNANIVCVALTGFGLTGPFRDEPAYDYIIQALCGLTLLTGEPNSPPIRAGYSVADNTGGMAAAIGTLAKLVSGSGGQVDISLYDVMLSQLNYLAAAYLTSGEEPTRLPSGGHSYFVPAQIFATRDGNLALFITHDRFWGVFCEAAGHTDWVADERFATMRARNENREVLVKYLSEMFRTLPTEEWLERLGHRGLVIAGVRSVAEALDSDRSRNMVISIETVGGTLRLVASPIHIRGVTNKYLAPPHLGEHTNELCGASAVLQ